MKDRLELLTMNISQGLLDKERITLHSEQSCKRWWEGGGGGCANLPVPVRQKYLEFRGPATAPSLAFSLKPSAFYIFSGDAVRTVPLTYCGIHTLCVCL